MTVAEFADANLCDGCNDEQLPNYIFDGLSNEETMALLGDRTERRPRAFLPDVTTFLESVPGSGGYERGSIQFSLGGALSGTPLHWHNDAINYLVRGTKLWTLLPPSAATYSRVHAQLGVISLCFQFVLHFNSMFAQFSLRFLQRLPSCSHKVRRSDACSRLGT